jgi:predicted amidohydrolase
MRLRVSAAQVPVTDDVDANVVEVLCALRSAADAGADILLTPEGALSGYTPRFDRDTVRAALDTVTGRAAELGVGLALGTCFEEADGVCYNQVRFYAASGDYLGFHAKTLRCASLTDPPVGELNDYGCVPLRVFEFAGVPVGALICNDLWANPGCTPMPDPHLVQQLGAMGARVVFHAVNGGRGPGAWSDVCWHYHDSNLRMRAQAAGVWVVTVDNSEPSWLRCSAPSGVVAPDGTWQCRAPAFGRRFFYHDIELS